MHELNFINRAFLIRMFFIGLQLMITTKLIASTIGIDSGAAFAFAFMVFITYSLQYSYKAKKALELKDNYIEALEAIEHFKELSETQGTKLQMLTAENKTYLSKIETLGTERQTYQANIKTLSEENETLKRNTETLSVNNESLTKRVVNMGNALNSYKDEVKKLSALAETLDEYKKKYRSAAAQVSALKGQLNKI